MARVAALAVVLAVVAGTPAAAATGVPVWPAASKLTLPLNASHGRKATSLEGLQHAELESVSCTGPGSCVAVGVYRDKTRSSQAMLATETRGLWGRASELTLPAGANTTADGQQASLNGIACTSLGNCVAAGRYLDAGNSLQAMVVTETDGEWGQASEIALPAGANASPGEQRAGLSDVQCTSSGNCVAVGFYTDSNGSKDHQPMVVTETDGVWAQASEIMLPADANATAGEQHAGLVSVACTAPGSCVAAGSYDDTNKNTQAMIATESGGAWGQASEVALPADALGVGPLEPAGAQCGAAACLQAASLDSVSCTSPGNCVAVGGYADASTECSYEAPDDCGPVFEAMEATETSGVWAQALTVGETSSGIAVNDLIAVACTGPRSCAGAGQQLSVERFMGGVNYENVSAMLAAETNGVWGHLGAATLPAGAAPMQEPPSGTPTPGGPQGPEENASVESLACTSPSSCVAVGYYLDNSESTQAMVLSSVSSLALITKHTISQRLHSARFSFKVEGEAHGSQCAFVRIAHSNHSRHKAAPKPHYASCHTPERYTKLAPGSYVFYVRTVGAGAEETPASRRFTIG
jgi:hypothetical protein